MITALFTQGTNIYWLGVASQSMFDDNTIEKMFQILAQKSIRVVRFW